MNISVAPNRKNSLFRTDMVSSEKYKSQADIDFERKEEETYQKLINEKINQYDSWINTLYQQHDNKKIPAPLYSIKNINIINMNRKGVQKTKTIHFGIKFLKSGLVFNADFLTPSMHHPTK